MNTLRNGRKIEGTGRASFTLAEMLAVMAIIAIIAGIIVAGSAYAQRQASAKRARAGLEKLKLAIEEYRATMGRVPDNSYNGSMTNNATWGDLASNTLRRVIVYPDDFVDPWGRAYLYTNRTRFSYLLMSSGPDDNKNATYDDITNEQAND